MDAHELNTWLILGTLFLLCLVGLGIGIYDTMKKKKEKRKNLELLLRKLNSQMKNS